MAVKDWRKEGEDLGHDDCCLAETLNGLATRLDSVRFAETDGAAVAGPRARHSSSANPAYMARGVVAMAPIKVGFCGNSDLIAEWGWPEERG
jgi:hypothetical protein